MKQNVTIEQLQELSPKAKEKLIALTSWDNLPHGAQMLLHNADFYLSEFLTIGKLIEFLDEGKYFKEPDDTDSYDVQVVWRISYLQPPGKDLRKKSFGIEWNEGIELCDALWEAVKQILEKE